MHVDTWIKNCRHCHARRQTGLETDWSFERSSARLPVTLLLPTCAKGMPWGKRGSDQSVCKNCPPCLPAFNGLQHKIKHIDHTLIRKHGACKGNMWDTLGSPRRNHTLCWSYLWLNSENLYISLLYWNLEWFSAARFPGNNCGCDSCCKNALDLIKT